jgi:hypothetical protein
MTDPKPRAGVRHRTVRGQDIMVLYRREFLTDYWHYTPGGQVAFVAPSQDGKTTLAFQMLLYTATPELPVLVLVMKPRDATPAAWSAHLGLIEVPTWDGGPPRKRWGQPDPVGWTLWPPHTFVIAIDNANLAAQFRAALEWAYAHGDCIVFADEVYGMVAELDLTPQLIALWSRGSGMGAGLWTATQRPSGSQGKGVPGFMYSNAHDLFLARDPDALSRRRYGEIGGVDPKLVEAIVMTLRRHEFLWISRGDTEGGPYLAIIEAR